ncbi:hypothetical protein, partial [Streptomyces sp. NPDC058330]
LASAGVPQDAPGVVNAGTGTEVLETVTQLLGSHRVWERFPTTA